MFSNTSTTNVQKVTKLITWILGGLVAIIVTLNSFTVVSVGNEAAISSFGEVHQNKIIKGFNIVAPWWNIDQYSLMYSTYTYDDLGIASQDKFKTNMDVAFTGSFLSGTADKIRSGTGTAKQFIQTHVNKRVLSCLTKAGAEVHNSQAFFDKGTQVELANSTITCVNDYLLTVGGYKLSSVQFSDIRLDPRVQSFMVETKRRQEKQNQALSDLAIAETNAQQLVKQSIAKLESSANTKKSRMLMADASKYEKQMEAQGNLELNKSLTVELISYIQAKRWDGKRSRIVTGQQTSLLLQTH